ncbi:aldehyde oxidase GLOX-like [Carica papaya]|uniref:aldehyde oxidase GLOX-like n=1 Tax=Carica papaya TaxID=3649 RepID=UPI000B8CE419|nr:aldehyde oxidase GLOX-like [Carica papaya]
MADKAADVIIVITVITLSLHFFRFSRAAGGSLGGEQGRWQLLLNSSGVVAAHMALTHHNTVLMFDQNTEAQSGYPLRQRYNRTRCGIRREDLDWSCYAHSVEYNILDNKIRALRLDTDPWCSSGSFLSNGTLVQTGGYGRGAHRIRYFRPCGDAQCDWKQSRRSLSDERWCSSNQLLPENDRVIVVGGRRVFTYEFVPKLPSSDKPMDLPFLHQTYEKDAGGNNLYPFLHLSSDGNLFIFANRDSVLLSYRRDKIIKTFPRIPGGGSRNYPSSGSSVILPLHHTNRFQKVEVMICGGSASGAYTAAENNRRFLKGLISCGRMVITGNKHKWNMENMPGPRVMSDMLILPTGHILIVNGAKNGCAGWNNAANAALQPYLYKPKAKLGRRFSVQKATRIPRMYHSSALLLPDGRVLVGGSNPNHNYTFSKVSYPTELRLQAFVPHYMGKQYHDYRPSNVSVNYGRNRDGVRYGEAFTVRFRLGRKPSNEVKFSAYAPPFTTHSVSMNQRMLMLRCRSIVREQDGWISAVVESPQSPNVAPSGYYLLTVLNGAIPSLSQWIRLVHA